jgi:hypothetical protein
MDETDEKKGCWVLYVVPSTTPLDDEEFHLTTPDGTVHRPDMVGKVVNSRVDGQEVEFEIQVPGEPVTRKARAPIDKAIKLLN